MLPSLNTNITYTTVSRAGIKIKKRPSFITLDLVVFASLKPNKPAIFVLLPTPTRNGGPLGIDPVWAGSVKSCRNQTKTLGQFSLLSRQAKRKVLAKAEVNERGTHDG